MRFAPFGVVLVLTVVLLASAGPVSSAAPVAGPKSRYVLRDGVTAPVYSYENAIRQSVWVEAPDRDGNGQKDLVTADIIRPRELDGSTKVPVIMDPSPYYLCCGRGNESERKTYDGNGDPRKFPLFYDNYFVPRGYAIVHPDMAGTARSSGCADEGAASDVDSIKAVVDWLNGRANAVDRNGNPVTASWSNGKAGLIGKSYDGTLANGVAATGVKGLRTIVPIVGISSWYDYTRSQNLPYSYNYPGWLSRYVAGSRTRQVDCSAINAGMDQNDGDETGEYTDFWSERDYRDAPAPSASKVTASVFLVHGLQDTNVKTVNFGHWLPLLQKPFVPSKVWLSRLGHVDPFDFRRADWVDTLHRWFDNQLMGIENGILDEPRVDAEVSPGTWVTSARWPVSDTDETFTFHADGSLRTGPPENGNASFVNNPNQSESQAIAKGNNPNRLLYVSGSLREDVRISGQATVDLTIRPQGPVGQVGVALVDYGTQVRVRDDGEGSRTLGTSSCWGDSTSFDDACYFDVAEDLVSTPLAVLARGWARLTGNQQNVLTVQLAFNDVVVPAGHQLGVAIFGASPGWTETLDFQATPYSVDLRRSSLSLPVVGGLSLAGNAGDLSQVPALVPPSILPDPTALENRLPY
jgi:X-Pro dipeptidyl-peptidase